MPPVDVIRPEHPWEGASAPNLPSVRNTAYGLVNQLRDPAIYEEGAAVYLPHAVDGECGITIARPFLTPEQTFSPSSFFVVQRHRL